MMKLKKVYDETAKELGIKLNWIDHSIGFIINNEMYLNKDLLLYPEYCLKVFQHEIQHYSNNTKTEDFMLDLLGCDLFENLKFCFRNPRGFMAFIPFTRHNNKMAVDVNMLVTYAVFLIVVGGVAFLLFQ